ncbi:MAG TPA: beta-phosphoglucomutase [Bacillota bacterium]|nr:beta-phosphoglucomutase [Bacillota bacterium]
MKRILKAVIFDLDGVIVDTFDLYYLANKSVADFLSVTFTREDNDQYRGIGRMEIVEDLVQKSGKNLSLEEKKKLADEKNRYYQQLLRELDESFILPGIKRFIEELKANQIKLGIASSSTNGKAVLEKTGLIENFDCIVDPTTLAKGKPDPGIFLKAAEELGVKEEKCAAIEDGVAGLKAINKTNMFAVGVGEAAKIQKADWHIDRTDELTYEKLVKNFER